MLIKVFIGNTMANQSTWLGSDVMVLFNILPQNSVQESHGYPHVFHHRCPIQPLFDLHASF